ncbi:antibiotic biosynthesis monooxygenase [Paraglaciecola sp.]|uniref:antibiotic biosynthesis monooxygenase family protein n=1 Tax=Paraglaciecola sp. TaxID=1920173 RepID=UPI0030F452DF
MICVIFEVIPKEERKNEYFAIASELKVTLAEMEGFISIERFQSLADQNKFLSLSFWKDEESVKAWREQTFHRQAQVKGRNQIFDNYRLRVATVLRDYGMKDRLQAPKTSVD